MIAARRAAAGVLLAGPTVLAFFSGGFFDEPRLWAGLAACALLAPAALVAPLPRPAAWLPVGALAALAVFVWLSAGWAPLDGPALADAERVALYAVTFLAAVMLLGAALPAVEPALALGTVVVTGYGLAGRLLPGVVDQSASRSALGRLEQPLTYWNATGALAAIGFALCARLAGDPSRAPWLRVGALAGAVPLGLAITLSFSRGALFALAVGLAVLIALVPTRAQGRAVVLAVALALPAALLGVAVDGVRALAGSAREGEGAAMLVVLLVLMAAGALLARRPPPEGRLGRPPLAAVAVAAVVLVGAAALAASGGRPSQSTPAGGATPSRLASADSNRYGYWRVALRSWAAHPLVGVGSGGFRVEWRRERTVADPARDAHSLPLETLAELGLAGFALLAGWAVGVARAAVAAWRADAAAAAGLAAGLVVWAVHACLDWDWEMPALTLVALLLAGALVALSDPRARAG